MTEEVVNDIQDIVELTEMLMIDRHIYRLKASRTEMLFKTLANYKSSRRL